MGNCCKKTPLGDTEVLDALRIRFPSLDSHADLVQAVRYGVAKTQLRPVPGQEKHAELLSCLNILVAEVGSDTFKAFYEDFGEAAISMLIAAIVHAGKNGVADSRNI